MEKQEHQQEDFSVANLEQQKLRLEIDGLKRQNRLIERIVQLVPVMTTFVAVAGLAFSFWNSQRLQRIESAARSTEATDRARNETQDRINKVQTQIRADKEQILEFATNDKISPIRVAFLIDDLKSLTEQLPKNESEKDINQQGKLEKEAKDSITELLRRAAWDLRFDESRHFDFDAYALRRWNNYRQLWKEHPGEHHYFLANKYHLRIKKFRDADPSCIEKLDYEEATTILTYKNADKACNQELIGAVIYVFGEHLRVIKEANQSDLLSQEVQEFGKLTNPTFAKKFFASL